MTDAPRLEDLATEFAIFPLPGALLLPGGKLPLNIFERRYLAMFEDCLSEGRVIGMIQTDELRPATPSGPALYKVGCLGRLSSFSETDDGRMLVTLTGLIRFTVKVELEMRRGYRRARADLARFRADLDETPQAGSLDRDGLVEALRAYFATRGFDANWEAIDEMPDEALVSTLSMVCPFDPAEKQALLEAPNTADRALTLLTLLQMGAHSAEPGRRGRQAS
ncbi:MAG: LON peptidase substrate-binding domain-containing protein [Janthinobacterium lividum]